MPFGQKNAAQLFQRSIDQVLHGLDFCFAYIDDLLIVSPDPETHSIFTQVFSVHSSMAYPWFLHHDPVRWPQQRACDGPYKVLKRTRKYFELDVNGRVVAVSVDHIKPALVSD